MKRQNKVNRDTKKNQPSFHDFWLSVASRLGSGRLHLNPHAADLSRFFIQPSDHTHHLRIAIEQSYRNSSCQSLEAPVNLIAVLDALGEAAYTLRNNHQDDLLDIELLEEIAWQINTYHSHQLSIDKNPECTVPPSRVISMQAVKIIKANTKL